LLRDAVSTLRGLDLCVFHRAAEEISGDVYGVIRLDDHRAALFVADAAGHGVTAALLADFVHRTIGLMPRGGGRDPRAEPAEVLTQVNETLYRLEILEGRFASLTYAVFDEESGLIRLARAGAPYPLLLPRGGSPRLLVTQGRLVGVMPEAEYETMELSLAAGDRLMLYSDGLEPLLNLSAGEPDEWKRSPWIRAFARTSTERQLAALDRLFEEARAGGSSLDDTTVVVLAPARRTQGEGTFQALRAAGEGRATLPAPDPGSPSIPHVDRVNPADVLNLSLLPPQLASGLQPDRVSTLRRITGIRTGRSRRRRRW
jgi:serine phosphatase RsbU (regulator of sigma subunit)